MKQPVSSTRRAELAGQANELRALSRNKNLEDVTREACLRSAEALEDELVVVAKPENPLSPEMTDTTPVSLVESDESDEWVRLATELSDEKILPRSARITLSKKLSQAIDRRRMAVEVDDSHVRQIEDVAVELDTVISNNFGNTPLKAQLRRFVKQLHEVAEPLRAELDIGEMTKDREPFETVEDAPRAAPAPGTELVCLPRAAYSELSELSRQMSHHEPGMFNEQATAGKIHRWNSVVNGMLDRVYLVQIPQEVKKGPEPDPTSVEEVTRGGVTPAETAERVAKTDFAERLTEAAAAGFDITEVDDMSFEELADSAAFEVMAIRGSVGRVTNVQYHVFSGSRHTVCCLTMENGFTVTGEAACVNPENFDEATGQRIAYEKATAKVWEYVAYLERENMMRKTRDAAPVAVFTYGKTVDDETDAL